MVILLRCHMEVTNTTLISAFPASREGKAETEHQNMILVSIASPSRGWHKCKGCNDQCDLYLQESRRRRSPESLLREKEDL